MSSDQKPQDSERIEAILAQLQEEITQHRVALGQMGALEPPDPLGAARQAKWVNPHLPIGWPTMPQGLINKLVAMTQKVVRRLLRWYINPIVDQQNRYNEAVYERLAADLTNINSVAGELHSLLDRVTQYAGNMTATSQQLDQVEASLSALITQTESLQKAAEAHETIIHDERSRRIHDGEVVRFRLQRLENTTRGAAVSAASVPATSDSQEAPPIDYYLLGLLHRSEDQMVARLSDYDDLVPRLVEGTVVDLGCGRGDFVAHLAELGIDACGVDLDGEAIAMGQDLGRNVVTEDMFVYLAEQPDGGLAAVSAIQVIEHLDWPDMRRLFALAAQKLAPGGLLLLETVNPTCITALTNAYLLDPSHIVPVHPQMAEFLLQEAGLADVQIRLLHDVSHDQQLAVQGDESEQQNWQRLNNLLYGPQDYAAIAVKREDA